MDGYSGPTRDYLVGLTETLSALTGCEMEGTYAVSELPRHAKSIIEKLLAENIVQTFSRASERLMNPINVDSSGAIAASIMSSPEFVQEHSFELGFGLGSGFQLYCDDTMVITAGGGGGGGINWRSAERTTFGGGSGFGIQLLETFGRNGFSVAGGGANISIEIDNWVSVGGGGGCGTCGTEDQSSTLGCSKKGVEFNASTVVQRTILSKVVCGDKQDENALSPDEFRTIIKNQYSSKMFGKICRHIRVSGGGGGGGGQVGCNYSEGGGFGFYFDLSCTNPRRHVRKNNRQTRVKQIPYEETSGSPGATDSTHDTTQSTEWSAYRDFGPLVQAAVGRCSGYGNWECVCTQARALLIDCAVITEDPSVRASWNTVNCTTLNQHNASYYKILNNSCKMSPHTLSLNITEGFASIGNTTNATKSIENTCGTANNILFSAAQSVGENQTHNISFYAGKSSSNDSYLRGVVSSLSLHGLSVAGFELDTSPLLLSENYMGSSSPGLSSVWLRNGIVSSCVAVTLFVALLWRYTTNYSQRNGYTELLL